MFLCEQIHELMTVVILKHNKALFSKLHVLTGVKTLLFHTWNNNYKFLVFLLIWFVSVISCVITFRILWLIFSVTSLGATRGLPLRGGNILEKFSLINFVVFDKTGTLTVGRPVVTKVVTPNKLVRPFFFKSWCFEVSRWCRS